MIENSTSLNTNIDDNAEPGIKMYIIIWGMLILFTAFTVLAANLRLGRIAVIVCLTIAAVKSCLVLLYFMHLRYEKKIVIKILMPVVIVAIAVFIGLTYVDVITR